MCRLYKVTNYSSLHHTLQRRSTWQSSRLKTNTRKMCHREVGRRNAGDERSSIRFFVRQRCRDGRKWRHRAGASSAALEVDGTEVVASVSICEKSDQLEAGQSHLEEGRAPIAGLASLRRFFFVVENKRSSVGRRREHHIISPPHLDVPTIKTLTWSSKVTNCVKNKWSVREKKSYYLRLLRLGQAFELNGCDHFLWGETNNMTKTWNILKPW